MKRIENINFSKIINLDIASISYNKLYELIESKINNKEKFYCIPVNLDVLRTAYYDEYFYKILQSSDLILADGMPLVWLSKLTKAPIKERLAGRKVVYDLCKLSDEKAYKIFMLGAAEGVANTAKLKLEAEMPNVKIVGTYSPSPKELIDPEQNSKIINLINNSGAEILFVAFGAPKQEKWIYENMYNMNPYIYIPCGGSIDFIAGVQKKTPEFIGDIGAEWLYRLIGNPKRLFKRYIINDLPFLIKLLFMNTNTKDANIKTAFDNILNSLKIINTNTKEESIENEKINK